MAVFGWTCCDVESTRDLLIPADTANSSCGFNIHATTIGLGLNIPAEGVEIITWSENTPIEHTDRALGLSTRIIDTTALLAAIKGNTAAVTVLDIEINCSSRAMVILCPVTGPASDRGC